MSILCGPQVSRLLTFESLPTARGHVLVRCLPNAPRSSCVLWALDIGMLQGAYYVLDYPSRRLVAPSMPVSRRGMLRGAVFTTDQLVNVTGTSSMQTASTSRTGTVASKFRTSTRLRLHRYVLSHTAATFKPFPLTAAITMQSPPGILIAGHTGRLSDGRLRIQASKLALLLICVFFLFRWHHTIRWSTFTGSSIPAPVLRVRW